MELVWSGPATGPVPDQYEVFLNGTEIAAVPGSTTDYLEASLDPGTSYQFSVVAIRGTMQSPHSRTLTVRTTTPPPSDAVLDWSGTVSVEDTVGSFTDNSGSKPIQRNPGDTWQESWYFTADCASGPCDATITGSLTGRNFSAQLSRKGLTYSGKATMDNSWTCQGYSQDYNSTLQIQVTGKSTGVVGGVWSITSFTATLQEDVDWGQSDCTTPAYVDYQAHSA